MIFGKELLPKVLDGSKTVTRRPPRDGIAGNSCKYGVGKTYAVQPVIEEGPGKGRGGKSVARIRIVSVTRSQIALFDANEARREGFNTAGEFRRYWEQMYGSFDPTQLVDRIEFELVPDSGAGS